MKNLLFICSRNKWRSRTAETIHKKSRVFNVRSAGTENSARIKVNSNLVSWADIIFVMETHHKEKLILNFPNETSTKKIIVLEIPDIYGYMDKELIEEIETGIESYLIS